MIAAESGAGVVFDRFRGKGKLGNDGTRIALGLVVLAVATVVMGLSSGWTTVSNAAGPTTAQPNVVLIQADDQTTREFKGKVMPRTMRLLARPGTSFTDYLATTPQCCPSRASLLTGQYAHNHGVFANAKGYPALIDKDNVLPAWLQQAGYNTIHVGKFLNGFWRFADRPAGVAPGWTDWRTVIGGRFGYYEYFLSRNGDWKHFGKASHDYITRVLTRNAVGAISRFAPRAAPFYLQLDQHAPHGSGGRQPGRCSGRGTRAAKPDPLDMDAFRQAPLPHPPSFNERRLGDKPAFLRHARPLSRETKQEVTGEWRCALASLVGLDRSVAAVYHAVKRKGELDRTVFIYISDNGLFRGEHRLAGGKVLPYEEALRLPLVIDVPNGYGAVRSVDEPVANIDLAPTILDLAHARPCPPAGACRTMDGRSLMPLITGAGVWPRDRGVLTEYHAEHSGRYRTCRYEGIRTSSSIYVKHYSVSRNPAKRACHDAEAVERYDLTHDPFELQNLCHGGGIASCPTDGDQASLEARLRQLSQCAGVEGRDERVDGRPFCE
jgi:N-acetylglucosamine-6-sulfatase